MTNAAESITARQCQCLNTSKSSTTRIQTRPKWRHGGGVFNGIDSLPNKPPPVSTYATRWWRETLSTMRLSMMIATGTRLVWSNLFSASVLVHSRRGLGPWTLGSVSGTSSPPEQRRPDMEHALMPGSNAIDGVIAFLDVLTLTVMPSLTTSAVSSVRKLALRYRFI